MFGFAGRDFRRSCNLTLQFAILQTFTENTAGVDGGSLDNMFHGMKAD